MLHNNENFHVPNKRREDEEEDGFVENFQTVIKNHFTSHCNFLVQISMDNLQHEMQEGVEK